MGEPIRKTAARDDILRDFAQTNHNASARGGIAADLAAQRLAPLVMIIESLAAQMKAAELLRSGIELRHHTGVQVRADASRGKYPLRSR